jgi:hypothetical protein
VEPSRLDQKPVETDYFKSRGAGPPPKIDGLCFTDFPRIFLEGKWGNFYPLIATFGDMGAAAVEIPSPVCLVAECKFHLKGCFLFYLSESRRPKQVNKELVGN